MAQFAYPTIWQTAALLTELAIPYLSFVPKGRNASALSIYRMVYAMTRERGLGHRAQRIPPTRQFAHNMALAEARKIDPMFEVSLPPA